MKPIPFIAFVVVACFFLSAPVVAQNSGDSYRVHVVNKGETLYSISRQFNVDLAELKRLNRIEDNNAIGIGAALIIPKEIIKDQQASTELTEVITPVRTAGKHYHIVKQGETLYNISRQYEGLNVKDLKKLNGLESNDLKLGQRLIIIKDENEEAVEESILPEKKLDVVAVNEPLGVPVLKNTDEEVAVTGFEDYKAEYHKIMATDKLRQTDRGIATWLDEGYDAGTNGYFALHKYLPIGSVIEVRNLMNSRIAYVKVIGKLPSTDDNRNVLVKLSSATAKYLNVLDEKFLVEVNAFADKTAMNQ